MKFLTNIDLAQNELQNFRIQNLGTAPSNPVVGQSYFDSILKTVLVWTGAKWADALYEHPASHLASMITQSSTLRFVSDAEKSVWNSKASGAHASMHSTGGSDAISPISIGAEPAVGIGTSAQYYRGDKTWQSLTKSVVSLGSVENYGISTTAEAQAGTSNAKYMTPLRTKEAIAGLQAIDSVAGRTGVIVLAKTDVGLGSVDDKSSATIRGEITSANVITALTFTPENAAKKGVGGGYAPLDSNAKIPLANLPDTAKQQTYVRLNSAERVALTGLISGDKCYEATTGDTYIWNGVAWLMQSDADWENVNLQWSNILGRPASSVSNIDIAVTNNHTHTNKAVLDGITSAKVTNWDGAHTHVSDVVRHITGAERTSWNTVTDKVDKITGKGLSAEDYTTLEKSKLTGLDTADKLTVTVAEKAAWNAKTTLALGSTSTTAYRGDYGSIAYAHSQAAHAPVGAQANQTLASGNGMAAWTTTSGDLTVSLGTPGTVTNATTNSLTATSHTHALTVTKADVGLGSVDDKSSATIRGEITSTNVTTALGFTPENAAKRGLINGYAALDSTGKVPESQLPAAFLAGGGGVYSEVGRIVLAADSSTASIAVQNFNPNVDTLIVYQNTTYIDKGIYYTINAEGTIITKVSGQWASGTSLSFILLKNVAELGVEYEGALIANDSITNAKLHPTIKIGDITTLTTTNKEDVVAAVNEIKGNTPKLDVNGLVDPMYLPDANLGGAVVSFVNSITLAAATATVDIGIPRYTKGTDTLIAHENSVYYLRRDIDYTVSLDGTKMTKTSGTWPVGTVIDFLVLKNVLDTTVEYDGVLILDGTVTNSKLHADIKIGSLATLTTTSKSSVVAAINENKTSVGTINTFISGVAANATKVENSATNGNIKINGVENTVFSHLTGAGNNHVPTGGAANQILRYSASGVATWSNENNTTYTAGLGLTLTGTVFTPTFGTTANTVTQGNDVRLSNARTPVAHIHEIGDLPPYPTSLPANGGDAATVGGFTVGKSVPVNALFTDTVYTHPAGTNPHGTTASDLGLGSVSNYGIATQAEAQVGTSDIKYMTPSKTKNAITALQSIDSVAGRTGAIILTKADVGLGSVFNYGIATQVEAQTGASDVKYMTPSKTKDAITALQAISSVSGRTGAITLLKTDVGLGSVENYGVATLAEAQVGTSDIKYMTPSKTKNAITALQAVSSVAGKTGAITLLKADVGLGSVENYGIATQAEAQAGTSNAKYITPLRAKEAIVQYVGSSNIAKKFTASFGNGSATEYDIVHDLGTQNIQVSVFENATNSLVFADVISTSVNAIKVLLGMAPTSNQYRVTVVG